METTVKRLFEVIRASSVPLEGLKVFVISEDHFFRLIDGRYIWSEFSSEYGYAKIDKLDRGKILSAFAKLEFLVNECINLHFLRASSLKTDDLASLVKKLPFRQRIESLHNFGIINSALEKNLKKLANVRNTLAHEWDEKVVKFDNAYLTEQEVFNKFNRHLVSSFTKLVESYRTLQVNMGYENYLIELISEIESKNGS